MFDLLVYTHKCATLINGLI